MPISPVQSKSRAESAAELIAAISADTAPGTRLGTKEEIRGQAKVSVGTFNEALRLAQAQGVVDVRPGPGGGIFAATPSPRARLGNVVLALDADQHSVEQAIRLRDALDPILVEDAIEYATPEDIARLWAFIDTLENTQPDLLESTRIIWKLHLAVCDISPNELIASIYRSLLDIIEKRTVSAMPDVQRPSDSALAERRVIHRRMVQAIADGDAVAAAEVMEAHRTVPPLALRINR